MKTIENEENYNLQNIPIKRKISFIESDRQILMRRIQNHIVKYGKFPETTLDFYNVQKLLGEGSYGKVYLGVSVLTGQKVALKCYQKKKIRNLVKF